jgi:hypothetical protein
VDEDVQSAYQSARRPEAVSADGFPFVVCDEQANKPEVYVPGVDSDSVGNNADHESPSRGGTERGPEPKPQPPYRWACQTRASARVIMG